jgi:DNA modification methylase
VDLIYLDPPFFSNRHYEVIWGDGYELRAFEDRWKGGINNYVSWMKDRLAECYRVLKPTGSMYLHCDWHASHYLKVEMDRLFGETQFINEIVWKRQVAHSDAKQGAKHLGRLHDVILAYGKTESYNWNPQYLPYSQEYVDKFYKHIEPETGRRYALDNIAGPGGASKGNPHYEFMGIKRYWRYSKERMEQLLKEGRIIQSKSGNVPRLKRYLDEMPGLQLQDIWDDILPPQQSERLGYPTQKPIVLLERIIKIGSNPKDLVLDPFCGCGTALAVAQKLGRQWIGIDVSPTACKLIAKRLRSLGAKNVEVMGMPMTEGDLRKIEPFEFQNWVISRLFGRVSTRKSSDMGIDGYTFEGFPVQVKQSEDIGRNVVDNFETAIRRFKKSKGLIVAFSFGKGANEEVARAKLHDGIDIELITVADLLKNNRNAET